MLLAGKAPLDLAMARAAWPAVAHRFLEIFEAGTAQLADFRERSLSFFRDFPEISRHRGCIGASGE